MTLFMWHDSPCDAAWVKEFLKKLMACNRLIPVVGVKVQC
jgi:hypothetical protein